MRIVYTRSNPINPYPRAEKEMTAAIKFGHTPIALGWDRKVSNFAIMKDEVVLPNGKVPIYRFNIKAGFGNGLSNLKPLLKWQYELLKWLIKNRKSYDLIHAYDFDTVLPALFMKTFFKKKYVYDICDFYIDAFSVPNLLKPLIKRLDFYAIKKSNTTIIVNETRVQQLEGSKPKKLEIIHNTPADISAHTTIQTKVRPRIFYGGILSDSRMIMEVISICTKRKEWDFVIAGYGKLEKQCKQAAEKYDNIHFLGKIPYNEIINQTLKSDLIFACYDPNVPNHRYSSPNKLYEAMMCSKPIVVSKSTGVDEIVSKEKIGLVSEFNSKSIESCFDTLLSDKNLSELFGLNARRLYDDKYNWSIMEMKLKSIYESV